MTASWKLTGLAILGTFYSVTTGSFWESKPDWLLSGYETKERTVALVPSLAIGGNRKLSFAKIMRTSKAAARVDE